MVLVLNTRTLCVEELMCVTFQQSKYVCMQLLGAILGKVGIRIFNIC